MVFKELATHVWDLIVKIYQSGEGVQKNFQNVKCTMEHHEGYKWRYWGTTVTFPKIGLPFVKTKTYQGD